MPEIARILVPVDFSERCLQMMPYVRQFAQRYQSEVILLHVFNPVYTIPDTALSGPITVPIPRQVFDNVAAHLEAFAVAEVDGLRIRRILYEGDPETQIAETAESEDVHLIMMPTRGHGVLRRFLLGSITSKVLHDVARPIVTGAHVNEHASEAISRVACAVDLGPHTSEVLSWAAQLAADFGAKLSIIHVVAKSGSSLETIHAELRKLDACPRDAALHVEAGEVANTVSSFAQRVQADLVVIGRGSQPGQTPRLRTNAYAIIRQSPCPVLSL